MIRTDLENESQDKLTTSKRKKLLKWFHYKLHKKHFSHLDHEIKFVKFRIKAEDIDKYINDLLSLKPENKEQIEKHISTYLKDMSDEL